MKRHPEAVVGASTHYGRAELVTMSTDGKAATLADKRRVELISPGLPEAPYHHEGLELPAAETRILVAKVQGSVTEYCRAAISVLRDAYPVVAVVVPASPYASLPDVDEVLASYQLTCAADGMMYRESFASAAAEQGLDVIRTPRGADEVSMAATALERSVEETSAFLKDLGRRAGPPWRAEHKKAAAAALSVLATRAEISLG